MNIIGNIIKTAISLTDTLSSDTDPVESQKEVLNDLLHTARKTEFGKKYNFKQILESDNPEEEFQKTVPVHDYDKMYDEWWHKVADGERDITWPERPDYFALSSGTTGNTSKRIPVTSQMLEAIRDTGIKQVVSLANFDLPAEFYEKEILMLGSSTDLKIHNDIREGDISGISAANLPFWFKGYYKPGEEVARIDEWDERIEKIVEKAPEWDIGALSGIPSWIELMLKAIIDKYNLKNIHELWPNLMVFSSGGVAFEPYEKSFNKLLAQPLTIIDTYLTSEGFLAFQSRPDTKSMALDVDGGIYFEFIPFHPDAIDDNGSVKDTKNAVNISEVKEGFEYILLISTVSGAWRYVIGDTVEITNKEKGEIRITGRTKHFLNVVGSQLSVVKMNDAMRYLEKEFNVTIPEFTVAAKKVSGEYIHKWYLGVENQDHLKSSKVGETLDEFLKSVNKNYKVARGKALKGVEVEFVSPNTFYDWIEYQKQKGGQVKFKRVMKEGEFEEWEEFASKQSNEKLKV